MTDLDAIVFTKHAGDFVRDGEVTSKHGIFEWRQDGTWYGCGATEPLEDLLARMTRSGPYCHEQYRILSAETRELVIKPTCYGCGLLGGINCDVTGWFRRSAGEFQRGPPVQSFAARRRQERQAQDEGRLVLLRAMCRSRPARTDPQRPAWRCPRHRSLQPQLPDVGFRRGRLLDDFLRHG